MKKFTLLFLFLMAPLAAATNFQVGDGFDQQMITFTASDAVEWQEVWNLPLLQQRIVEYVPAGETAQEWSEMVTVQFLVVSLTDPTEFFTLFQQSVEASNESAVVEAIESGPDSATWEWRISRPSANGDIQHEITRLIRADGGWFRIAYTKRVAKLGDAERSEWIERIQSAKVKA